MCGDVGWPCQEASVAGPCLWSVGEAGVVGAVPRGALCLRDGLREGVSLGGGGLGELALGGGVWCRGGGGGCVCGVLYAGVGGGL